MKLYLLDIDALVRELEASTAELTKSQMVIGMLRSPGLPAVTVKSPVFDSHHDASADMRAALVATTSALNFMSQNGNAKVPRKLKLTPFKTADDKNTIGDIMYRWESEFEAAGQGISVAVIVRATLSTLGRWDIAPAQWTVKVRCKLIHKIQKTS